MKRENLREKIVGLLHRREYGDRASYVCDQELFDLTDKIIALFLKQREELFKAKYGIEVNGKRIPYKKFTHIGIK